MDILYRFKATHPPNQHKISHFIHICYTFRLRQKKMQEMFNASYSSRCFLCLQFLEYLKFFAPFLRHVFFLTNFSLFQICAKIKTSLTFQGVLAAKKCIKKSIFLNELSTGKIYHSIKIHEHGILKLSLFRCHQSRRKLQK